MNPIQAVFWVALLNLIYAAVSLYLLNRAKTLDDTKMVKNIQILQLVVSIAAVVISAGVIANLAHKSLKTTGRLSR